jgi:kynureninase
MNRDGLLGRAAELDDTDALAHWRHQFDIPDRELAYLDGNSLGMPPKRTLGRLTELLRAGWAGELIDGWQHWLGMPQRVGDMLAPLIGAAPGEVVVHDSVTVNVYQLVRAALRLNPHGHAIAIDPGDFPTDRYVAEGIAAADGREVRAGFDELDDVTVALRSMVDYRTAEIVDIAAETARIGAAGALVIWDLSHAAGVHPIGLRAAGAQLAVGCTYKFLNGGPGSPAFAYVAQDLIDRIANPIQGWFSQRDQFAMENTYTPRDDIGRLLLGTPSILALAAAECGIEVTAEASIEAIRAKSVALGRFGLQCCDALGLRTSAPRDDARRGGHICVHEPAARELTPQLFTKYNVLADYRDPDVIRLGCSPLTTRFVDIARATTAIAELRRPR